MASPLFVAHEQLRQAIEEAERRWFRRHTHHRIGYVMRDLNELMDRAIPMLDELVAGDEALLAEHRAFERATEQQRLAAHDAYRRALELAHAVDEVLIENRGERRALEDTAVAVRALLDRMTPFISRADDGLRMVSLEGYSIDDVLELIRTTLGPLSKRQTR